VGSQVLERAHELATLAGAARAAANGAGSVALVYGEAGIGKSTLVMSMRPRLPAEGRMLVGYCDDLGTPRTLGPFRDLVGSVGPRLSAALQDGQDRDAVLHELRRELDWAGHPTVLVIEDVHWADDATLDALVFLVRRIDQMPAVLVLTYRPEEIRQDQPVQRLLGHVAAAQRAHRLPLRRLSRSAVETLSIDRGLDAANVYRVTGGNPFFVHEVLASGGDRPVPPTVVDAVLARVRRLDPQSLSALELLAVLPSAIDRNLVSTLAPDADSFLAIVEERGLLSSTPTSVAFRHELVRRSIVDALPAARRAELNRRVLAAIAGDPAVDVARLMHHAIGAGDVPSVLEYGPRAAREAISAGAHRQAVGHLAETLKYRHRFAPADEADLLEQYAVECYTVGAAQAAVNAQVDAIRIRRSLGEQRPLGVALRWLSRMHWWNGDRLAAEQAATEAVHVAESAGDQRLLALAYSGRSQLSALAYQNRESIEFGEKAAALARRVSDDGILAHALTSVGMAQWDQGQLHDGKQTLNESIRIALAAGETEHALRAYVGISSGLLDHFRLNQARPYLEAGLELAYDAEQVAFHDFLVLEHARLSFLSGTWDDTVREVEHAIDATQLPIRWGALMVLGRVQARRGEPAATNVLRDAWQIAVQLGEMQRTAPVAAGLAEAAWLRGDAEQALDHACRDYEQGRELGNIPLTAELGYWLGKAGERVDPIDTEHPYALLMTGRWRDAAAVWLDEGCPYEHALALTESTDPADLLLALATLDALRARPLARIVRARLRALGVAHVPRGPSVEARSNAAGLTARQVDVIRLIAAGATNRDIADQLVLSERTVEHHVAAIYDKLGSRTRRDAATRAAELGLVESPDIGVFARDLGTRHPSPSGAPAVDT
jgi:DNA-binding CsgD family transcriptional regulator